MLTFVEARDVLPGLLVDARTSRSHQQLFFVFKNDKEKFRIHYRVLIGDRWATSQCSWNGWNSWRNPLLKFFEPKRSASHVDI